PPSTTARLRALVGRTLGPYRRWRPSHLAASRRGVTLLLWDRWYGAAAVVADQHRQGRRTLFLARGCNSTRIVDVRAPWRRGPVAPLTVTDSEPPPSLDPGVASLLDEIDDWAGVDGAGRLLTRRVAVLLHRICP